MRWAGHAARGRQKRGMEFLVRGPDGKRPLGRPRRRWGITLKLIFKK
jgi:hypothetical protein